MNSKLHLVVMMSLGTAFGLLIAPVSVGEPATMPKSKFASPTVVQSPRLMPRAIFQQPNRDKGPENASTSNLPPWWPQELAMPRGTVLKTKARSVAVWENAEANRKSLRDFFVNEGEAARFRTYAPKFDVDTLYFYKGAKAYSLMILQSEIIGTEMGSIEVKTTGAIETSFDVPLPQGDTVKHSGRFELKSFMRGWPNSASNTEFELFMSEYKGPGTFMARGGTIPAAPPNKERYAGECEILIKDDFNGTFDCRGMMNRFDKTKVLNASGAWRLLPTGP